jgi:hypothetical protein
MPSNIGNTSETRILAKIIFIPRKGISVGILDQNFYVVGRE